MDSPYCFETLACRMLAHFTAHGEFNEAAMRSAMTALGVEEWQRLAKQVAEAPIRQCVDAMADSMWIELDMGDVAEWATAGGRYRLMLVEDADGQ